MTAEQFIEVLERVKAAIQDRREEIAIGIASDATALIAQRVQGQGLNAQGSTFGVYSPFTQQFKQDTNRTRAPFPNINFTQTAEMWKSIKPIAISSNGEIQRIAIGTQDPTQEAKLRKNVNRFGEIIELSDQEIQMIRLTVFQRFRAIFSEFNL